jgi:hypothetical protein
VPPATEITSLDDALLIALLIVRNGVETLVPLLESEPLGATNQSPLATAVLSKVPVVERSPDIVIVRIEPVPLPDPLHATGSEPASDEPVSLTTVPSS